MRQKIGFALLAVATMAFALTIAGVAEARQRGSWGGRASWGSVGSWSSHGSFGGRFARWRNGGSWGSHGGYASHGSFGCHGSHGGYYFNVEREAAVIHGAERHGEQASKEYATAREPEVAAQPREHEARYRGEQTLGSDSPTTVRELEKQQDQPPVEAKKESAPQPQSTQPVQEPESGTAHVESGPSLNSPETSGAP